MPRHWSVLLAEAKASGTYNDYQGDGASVPWEVGNNFALWAGRTMFEYKAHLDERYPEAFRFHDWAYTPYGSLIGITREEADEALSRMVALRVDHDGNPQGETPTSFSDSGIVAAAVRIFGGPWFGGSQTGFDQGKWIEITGQNIPVDFSVFVNGQSQFIALNRAIWELPPMAVYKYSVGLQRIEGKPPAGFSETWYFNAGSDTEARTRANDYVSERAKVLSKSWQVGTFSRLSIMAATCKRFKPQGKEKYCCVPRVEGRVQCVCPTPLAGKIAVDTDQNWDGLLTEMCTNPILHTGCSKCEAQTKPFVRQYIMRGIPDTWYSGGNPAISSADQTKVRAFLTYLKDVMKVGSVGCSDACSETSETACTSIVFALFEHVCPRFDQIHKRNTGRPFGLSRGRRSKRKAA